MRSILMYYIEEIIKFIYLIMLGMFVLNNTLFKFKCVFCLVCYLNLYVIWKAYRNKYFTGVLSHLFVTPRMFT
jgi:hypothetical protein